MKNKKICFVAQFPPPIHGLSKAVETLFDNLNSEEFECEKINITDNRHFIRTVYYILKSNADLFYFTISQTIGGNLRDLIILNLFKIKKKKVLIHLHGGYYRNLIDRDMKKIQKKANYRALAKVDGAVVLGPSLKWIFEGVVSDEKIYIVPNCIDNEFLMSDEEFKKKLNRIKNEEIHHVLWLSNFIRSKGYLTVLEMAKKEKERVDAGGNKKFHYDFAGAFFDDTEKNIFEDYIVNNNLYDYVTYHGVILGTEKQELLKKCTFFCLPTRYPKEGQPISILEAMGNGMAIFTTNHAGIVDIVKDDVNGYIMDENNLTAFLDRVNSIDNNDIYKFIKINRNLVVEKYNQREYINKMEEVFRSVLEESRG